MLNRVLITFSLLFTGNLLATTSLAAIDNAFSRGEISADEMILNKIYSLLDPERVDTRFNTDEQILYKCGTPILMQFERMRPQLSDETIRIINTYLSNSTRDLRSIYLTPGGHFSIDYLTTGTNAVPSADTDTSGVPDYVERAAEFLDLTWTQELDSAGFGAPNHTGGDGRYNVSFENLGAGFYGYCDPSGVDGNELTHLVLSSTFSGMGGNDDPEGTVMGAMKVTCAHEFKHASQRVNSGWSETIYWNELDATWAEEFVFDYVNDSMHNFMGYGDPFSHPHWGLDNTNTHQYEDYPWEDFLHQRFGDNSYDSAPLLVDYWNWRSAHTTQNVPQSYDAVLNNWGSSFADAFKEYVVWNFFTGSRSVIVQGVSQFGYDDAGINGFPTANLAATHVTFPVSSTVSGIDNMACKMIRLNTSNQIGLEITFDGQDGVEMSAMWAILTDSNTVEWGSIELDDNNAGDIVLDVRDASMAALIPVVTQLTGSSYSASYTIEPDALAECDPGDINDDGYLDVSDLVRLVAIILGNGEVASDVELCASDVNDDGQSTVQDVVSLVDLILQ